MSTTKFLIVTLTIASHCHGSTRENFSEEISDKLYDFKSRTCSFVAANYERFQRFQKTNPSIATTQFRINHQFEKALLMGYQPTPADLALVIMVSPENTKLVRTLIDDYNVFPGILDKNGNNLLNLIRLSSETVDTVCYLIRSKVSPTYKNLVGISFLDKLARTCFEGKQNIVDLLSLSERPFYGLNESSDNDESSSNDDQAWECNNESCSLR